MKLIDLVKVSINGTNWMTIYMNFSSALQNKQMNVIKILGSSLTNESKYWRRVSSSKEVKIIGTIGHYSVGLLFTLLFHVLWKKGIMKPGIWNGAALGTLTGIFGISVWKLFLKIHPNPPRIPVISFLGNLIVAHAIFGIGTALSYNNEINCKN